MCNAPAESSRVKEEEGKGGKWPLEGEEKGCKGALELGNGGIGRGLREGAIEGEKQRKRGS